MTAPSGLHLSDRLLRLLRLIKKELAESLRDRRTVFTLVLMPLLLYPVLAMAFQQMLLYNKVEKGYLRYRLACATPEEATSLRNYWKIGLQYYLNRHGGPEAGGKKPEEVPTPLPIPELQVFVTANVVEAVRSGEVDVGIILDPPGPFPMDPRRLIDRDLQLVYREDSLVSRDGAKYLEQLTADANAQMVSRQLQLRKIEQRGDPIQVTSRMLEAEKQRSSLMPVLIPLILILMTMTGAVYPAIDLTAGERERGTLEVLVAAPIPRMSVLFAKYVAVLAVAMLTAIVNLGTMALTLQLTGMGPAIFGSSISPRVLAVVFLLLILFAMFFSAVLLTLTSFARSFKEAQAYLIPLMLFCLTPGIMALMPGLTLNGPLAVVPLVNIVLLARDVLEGSATAMSAAVVVVLTLVYALAAITVAARVFGTEAVLSRESSGWGGFFYRPTNQRSRPEASGALLCLALLFPAYFLMTNGLAQLQNLDLGSRLILSSLAGLVLFMGFPLLAAWRGKVSISSGFSLLRPPEWFWFAGGLLGISLWPFIHEIVLISRQMGIATLPDSLRTRISELIGQWRTLSPMVIVAAMALIPAIAEEFFFRGYLLNALRGQNNRESRAALVSSALFSLFHLLVSDSMAVERLLPSFLLGMILARLALRSGSIFPGILLHALHNSCVVLLGYYEPRLTEMGWIQPDQQHYPSWLLLGSALIACTGFLFLILAPNRVNNLDLALGMEKQQTRG
ncbi:MAG: ABC transporter permease subunit/CPBP intramembrane protease [Gemmataceae bacterium]